MVARMEVNLHMTLTTGVTAWLNVHIAVDSGEHNFWDVAQSRPLCNADGDRALR
jgi:hypothetical protein